MIGRQIGMFPSQPPNWMKTGTVRIFLGREIIDQYAFKFVLVKTALGGKVIDQKPSTGTVPGRW